MNFTAASAGTSRSVGSNHELVTTQDFAAAPVAVALKPSISAAMVQSSRVSLTASPILQTSITTGSLRYSRCSKGVLLVGS